MAPTGRDGMVVGDYRTGNRILHLDSRRVILYSLSRLWSQTDSAFGVLDS
jgi:hypothetical protein